MLTTDLNNFSKLLSDFAFFDTQWFCDVNYADDCIRLFAQKRTAVSKILSDKKMTYKCLFVYPPEAGQACLHLGSRQELKW